MRVLFVNRMAAMVRGGGETFDLEIARRLGALGCEISFLTGIPVFGRARLSPREWWPDADISNFEIRISNFHVRSPYLGWFPWDSVRGGWRVRLADFWWFEAAAARWAARHADRFDVIQVCELPTFVMKWKRLGAAPPVVMRLTAPDYHDEAGAIRVADALVASGTTMEKVRGEIRPDCVDIPNAVDIGLFRPHASSFRRDHGIADDEFVVLFVARFQAVKNHRMLLDAFARARQAEPRLRLVLVGSGPLEGDVRARSEALGLGGRVVVVGEMPFAQVADVYAAADLGVISSDYESFSFAALETMATGLPLVATATEWVPGLIGSRAPPAGGRGIAEAPGGLVVPVGDSGATADAIVTLARDRDARRRMGAWNRARAESDFTWDSSARKLLDVYRRLVPAARTP